MGSVVEVSILVFLDFNEDVESERGEASSCFNPCFLGF